LRLRRPEMKEKEIKSESLFNKGIVDFVEFISLERF
jgi:hypothetical protein